MWLGGVTLDTRHLHMGNLAELLQRERRRPDKEWGRRAGLWSLLSNSCSIKCRQALETLCNASTVSPAGGHPKYCNYSSFTVPGDCFSVCHSDRNRPWFVPLTSLVFPHLFFLWFTQSHSFYPYHIFFSLHLCVTSPTLFFFFPDFLCQFVRQPLPDSFTCGIVAAPQYWSP